MSKFITTEIDSNTSSQRPVFREGEEYCPQLSWYRYSIVDNSLLVESFLMSIGEVFSEV